MRVLVSGNYIEAMTDESRAMWEAKSREGWCEILPSRPESFELSAAHHRMSEMLCRDGDVSLVQAFVGLFR